jgi:5-formyltetrahydrofolate cyclo-ligase
VPKQLSCAPPSQDWADIRHWRVAMRKALIGGRMSLDAQLRQARGERARRRLTESVDLRQFAMLGIYWPVRGEIDVRELAIEHLRNGGRVGLPVVVTQSAPLEFWRWQPGSAMSKGIWNIPIPAQREVLNPDALIVPLVGWDPQRYRLGYGGGYYDRTIAAAAVRPYRVGIGYEAARLDSIFPQPHDVPMDMIVTDETRT